MAKCESMIILIDKQSETRNATIYEPRITSRCSTFKPQTEFTFLGKGLWGSFSTSANSPMISSLSSSESSSRAESPKGDSAKATEAPKNRTSRRVFILITVLCCLQGYGMNSNIDYFYSSARPVTQCNRQSGEQIFLCSKYCLYKSVAQKANSLLSGRTESLSSCNPFWNQVICITKERNKVDMKLPIGLFIGISLWSCAWSAFLRILKQEAVDKQSFC